MYYKGVNRGLAFTKPGVYVFALVLVIGMIAVTTGINGLYVFLSAGLGGFIVSGLLSERAMKSAWVRGVAGARVDAESPFTLSFTLENTSTWFSVFALDVMFVLQPPRFRLVSGKTTGLAGGRLLRVPPGGARSYEAGGSGLPRGVHKQFLAVHQTVFPFGILEKFKMTRVPASLIVVPRLDPVMLDELRPLLRRALASMDAEKEFYCHRSFTPHDGMKDLDWRKSANRPQHDWVVKQYRSPAGVAPLCLDAPWAHAATATTEASYERYLVRVRTALKALEEAGRTYYLDCGDGAWLAGYEHCLAALAAAPVFAERARGLGADANTQAAPRPARLIVSPDGFAWRAAGSQQSAS